MLRLFGPPVCLDKTLKKPNVWHRLIWTENLSMLQSEFVCFAAWRRDGSSHGVSVAWPPAAQGPLRGPACPKIYILTSSKGYCNALWVPSSRPITSSHFWINKIHTKSMRSLGTDPGLVLRFVYIRLRNWLLCPMFNLLRKKVNNSQSTRSPDVTGYFLFSSGILCCLQILGA